MRREPSLLHARDAEADVARRVLGAEVRPRLGWQLAQPVRGAVAAAACHAGRLSHQAGVVREVP
eukprot:4374978-Alexandrium_andersonii.AAC.1